MCVCVCDAVNAACCMLTEVWSPSLSRNNARRAEQADKKKRTTTAAPKGVRIARKPAWFEKFFWFITSDNIIVIAGHSAQENELIVKRYLRAQVSAFVWQYACGDKWCTDIVCGCVHQQDIYVHADVHGAATVVIRNPSTDPKSADKIPPATLEQAAAFTVQSLPAHPVLGPPSTHPHV